MIEILIAVSVVAVVIYLIAAFYAITDLLADGYETKPATKSNEAAKEMTSIKDISKNAFDIPIPEIKQISENHWVLPLEHDGAAYSLTIREIGDWLSYGAELMADVEGEKSDEFYRKILELNRILNGAHIAKEGNKLILLHNDLTSHINEEELIKYLAIFHRSHEYVLKEILNEGAELGVKFKT